MADDEKQDEGGLFDAVEPANESQVAAEIWTRHFASTDTRRMLRFCQEQPFARAESALGHQAECDQGSGKGPSLSRRGRRRLEDTSKQMKTFGKAWWNCL